MSTKLRTSLVDDDFYCAHRNQWWIGDKSYSTREAVVRVLSSHMAPDTAERICDLAAVRTLSNPSPSPQDTVAGTVKFDP